MTYENQKVNYLAYIRVWMPSSDWKDEKESSNLIGRRYLSRTNLIARRKMQALTWMDGGKEEALTWLDGGKRSSNLIGPRDKAEGWKAEEEQKDNHLTAKDTPDKGVVLGVQQVHHHVLNQVQVLQLRPEHDQIQGRVGLQFASLRDTVHYYT